MGGADDEGSVDEVDALPHDLLGPVDEFTLSLSEDVVRAAMAMTSQSSAEVRETPPTVSARSAARAAAPPAPESVPSSAFSRPADSRFAKARPGSRSLPSPRAAPDWSPHDPLTTGVVPGGNPLPAEGGPGDVELRDARAARPDLAGAKKGVGQHTSELMLDGLDGNAARPASANPPSERLPEVPMPQPDTSRARRPGGLSGALRPRARPDPLPEPAIEPVPEPKPKRKAEPAPSRPGPAASLEELLTLADEPPEREDTVSGTVDLLSSLGEAPPTVERSEPTALRRAAEPSTLTGALEPIDEPEPTPGVSSGPAAPPPAPAPSRARPAAEPPRPARDAEPARRPTAKARPRPEPLPEPSLPEPAPEDRPARLDPSRGGPLAADPLATRPIPRLDEPEAPAAPPPAPTGRIAKEAAPRAERAPARQPREGKARDDSAGDRPARGDAPGDAAVDAFVNEKIYREPILGWLATLIGTVMLVGMIFFAIVVILWLLAR